MATGTGRIPLGKNEVFHTATVDRLIMNGDAAIVSAGQIVIDSSEAAADAIRIVASNAAGGIDVDAGTGGIALDTTGPLSLDSTSATAASNFTTVGAAGVDLTVSSTAGSLILTGGEAAADAVLINASNAAGGIDVNAGTGGIAADTTGGISLDSTSVAAASNVTTVGAAGVDLTVASTAGSLILTGGEAAADAVRINASNATGGIDVDAGTGGITLDTSGGLSLDSTSVVAASNIRTVGAAGVNLTVASTAGSLLLQGGEGVADAVRIDALTAGGGIDVNASTGGISVSSAATGATAVDFSVTGGFRVETFGAAAGAGDVNLTSQFASIVLSSGETVADSMRLLSAGGIDVDAGGDGIAVDTSGGISIDSTSAVVASNITTVGAAGVDLTVNSTAGSLILQSGEAAADAVRINAPNDAGGVDVDCGTGGITLDTSGGFSIDSTSLTVASNISTAGGPGFDLTVNSTLGSLNLTAGEAAANAVRIQASNLAGGIDVDAGSGGMDFATIMGPITLTAGTDLTVGASAGSLTLSGGEAVADAIQLTAAAGGIVMSTAGQTQLDGATFNAAAIAGVTAVTSAQSGTWFTVAQTSAYAITIPDPPTAGLYYKFAVITAGAFDVTVSNGQAHLFGTIVNDVTSVIPATGTTLTVANGVAAVGDTIEIYGLDATHYLVKAVTSANGGITVA